MEYECWKIAGHDLEYIDSDHQYLIDGVCVPSVTQVLKYKFANKYDGINKETLKRAAEQGTAVHKAIEDYCREGIESELPELRNFKFIQRQYEFTVLENEVPVILFMDDEPVCAGRLDMIVDIAGMIGIVDIKRTSTLDKDYLAHQLNLYRIAYRQSYGVEADFLRGLHLREDTRKFVNIPINEKATWEFIGEYLRKGEKNHE